MYLTQKYFIFKSLHLPGVVPISWTKAVIQHQSLKLQGTKTGNYYWTHFPQIRWSPQASEYEKKSNQIR